MGFIAIPLRMVTGTLPPSHKYASGSREFSPLYVCVLYCILLIVAVRSLSESDMYRGFFDREEIAVLSSLLILIIFVLTFLIITLIEALLRRKGL